MNYYKSNIGSRYVLMQNAGHEIEPADEQSLLQYEMITGPNLWFYDTLDFNFGRSDNQFIPFVGIIQASKKVSKHPKSKSPWQS